MCEYCTCRIQPSIERFGVEHELVEAVSAALMAAHADGDRPRVRDLAGELLAVLGPHVRREESALFPALDDAGAGRHTAELREDHEELDAVFEAVAADVDSPSAWAALPAAVDRLHEHIWREEYDVFPAAIQLLDPFAWQRVEDLCDADVAASAGAQPV